MAVMGISQSSHFGCSAVAPDGPGQMAVWQKARFHRPKHRVWVWPGWRCPIAFPVSVCSASEGQIDTDDGDGQVLTSGSLDRRDVPPGDALAQSPNSPSYQQVTVSQRLARPETMAYSKTLRKPAGGQRSGVFCLAKGQVHHHLDRPLNQSSRPPPGPFWTAIVPRSNQYTDVAMGRTGIVADNPAGGNSTLPLFPSAPGRAYPGQTSKPSMRCIWSAVMTMLWMRFAMELGCHKVRTT